jgi:hypothetical protein
MKFKSIIDGAEMEHYNGWGWIIDKLKNNISLDESGIILDTFIDIKIDMSLKNPAFFNQIKSLYNRTPQHASNYVKKHMRMLNNYETDWLGILHAFEYSHPSEKHVTLYNFIDSPWFSENKKFCSALITMSAHAADILKKITDVPIFYTYHPKTVEKQFNIELYFDDPIILHAGFHNRNFSKFAKFKTQIPKKINVINKWFASYIKNCYQANNIQIYEANTVRVCLEKRIDNSYIDSLTKSVGFCYLYSTNANNAVLEHIMSHTPLIVNKLPAIVEYIGEDYPMFYENIEHDPDKYLLSKSFLGEVSSYLKERSTLDMFKIENFIDFFKNLEIK